MLITAIPVSSLGAAGHELAEIGKLLRLGQLVGRELVLVLVVVARVVARDQRFLAQLSRTSRSFLVSSKSIMGFSSDRHGAFEHAERARVAVPHLDRVLADEAVAAEHLDAVVGDPHAFSAA